jgi:hypothetical protein
MYYEKFLIFSDGEMVGGIVCRPQTNCPIQIEIKKTSFVTFLTSLKYSENKLKIHVLKEKHLK